MPNPGKCYRCGRIMPMGRTSCACGGEATRQRDQREASPARPCASCAHYEECPEASLAAFSCYYEDHPEVPPLT